MYDIFGKYGAIFQIRLGDRKDTRGTAFVVYEGEWMLETYSVYLSAIIKSDNNFVADIYDAKAAVDHLSGKLLFLLHAQHMHFSNHLLHF